MLFDPEAWLQYVAWQQTNPLITDKINRLIEECRRTPFKGLGKPEPLRQNLKGWWSRRVIGEHRLVYRVRVSGEAQLLEILSCRFHY